jgi:hypothetical protein
VVLAAIWVLLTFWRPAATFHFAPLLVAVAWPYITRVQTGHAAAGWAAATPAVLGGAAVGLLTTAGLTIAGGLDGPTFWGTPGAPLESVAMTLLGAALGARVLLRRRSGWLFPDADVEAEPSQPETGQPAP